jgi:hypothetical protein
MIESIAREPMNGINHSEFCPVKSLSINIRENAGLMIPISDMVTVVITVNATATPAPRIFSFEKDIILLGLPPGSKFSEGSNIRHIPVKDLSKFSTEMLNVPLAGSLRIALCPLNPFRTTK